MGFIFNAELFQRLVSLEEHPDGFCCFLALIFKNILFLFKTSDHGVAWASEERKFWKKKSLV